MRYLSAFSILVITLATSLHSQITEGKIIYVESNIVNVDSILTALEENEYFTDEMKTMIKKGMEQRLQGKKKELIFNKEASLYQAYVDTSIQEETPQRGGMMVMRMGGGQVDNDITYQSIQKQEVIQKKEFLDKDFIIQEPQEKKAWKITGQQKKILDYNCLQATYSDSTMDLMVYFAPNIPVPLGPANYGMLPGMIMEVQSIIGSNKFIIRASEVNTTPIDASIIVAPSKGKSISKEEFDAMREAKLKELKENYSGGGMRHMMIR